MSNKKITGIVLAGGKSSRMGSDKGMIQLNGKLFIEHVIEALLPNVDEVLIIANTSNYNELGYKVFADIIKDCGPLGGIYTGLMNSKTENNVIVSCDIPFLNSELVKHVIENMADADIAVPIYKGNIEPLCAIYTKRITDKIYSLLQNKEFKIRNILGHFKTKEIEIKQTDYFYNDKLLVNINTPEELKKQKETLL